MQLMAWRLETVIISECYLKYFYILKTGCHNPGTKQKLVYLTREMPIKLSNGIENNAIQTCKKF
jgi:hypothetical protein